MRPFSDSEGFGLNQGLKKIANRSDGRVPD